MDWAFAVVSKKSSTQDQDDFLCLILRVLLYYVLCLHFESILCTMWGKTWSVFLHMDRQLSQDHLLTRLSFLHWIDCAYLSKINWLMYIWVCLWIWLSVCVCLDMNVILFWFLYHFNKLWSQVGQIFQLFFFSEFL